MYENFGFFFETFYDKKFKFLREISSDPGGNPGITSTDSFSVIFLEIFPALFPGVYVAQEAEHFCLHS